MADHFPLRVAAKRSTRRAVFRLGAVIALIVAVALALQLGAGPLRAVGVVPAPQKYVALSFAHPTALPSKLGRGAPLHFTFEVANDTGARTDQSWYVALEGKGWRQVVARGSRQVPPGRTARVEVRTVTPRRLRVTVVQVGLGGNRVVPLEFHVNSSLAAH